MNYAEPPTVWVGQLAGQAAQNWRRQPGLLADSQQPQSGLRYAGAAVLAYQARVAPVAALELRQPGYVGSVRHAPPSLAATTWARH